ncbi:MAG: hypothetical protein NZ480_01300 [Bdellovibrionaceae bacterium]|nr:hypothetical protein [Pseudobdellovibrionaceae bacterium]MDW8191057.1 hypothetical protein [Pseudobdellovibrionaceae bacterium]
MAKKIASKKTKKNQTPSSASVSAAKKNKKNAEQPKTKEKKTASTSLRGATLKKASSKKSNSKNENPRNVRTTSSDESLDASSQKSNIRSKKSDQAAPLIEASQASMPLRSKGKRVQTISPPPEVTSDAPHYQRWLQYKKKYGGIDPVEYDMKKKFEEKTPIFHPKLGWGFILSIENDRLHVLFAQGIKILISNYNPVIQI